MYFKYFEADTIALCELQTKSEVIDTLKTHLPIKLAELLSTLRQVRYLFHGRKNGAQVWNNMRVIKIQKQFH